MGYILKYAVLWEEDGEYELASDDYFDTEEEALDFIKDMEEEE
jgi:hypothetical protein